MDLLAWSARRWALTTWSSTGQSWRTRRFSSHARGATRLGFALLLKFYTQHGRFPRGRAELPDEAVEHVARQMKGPAAELGLYERSGSTILLVTAAASYAPSYALPLGEFPGSPTNSGYPSGARDGGHG
ncbi:DUF4158 domain-containing protein [Nonomuraea sp. NPDC050227]|uniref:DUF4158 domain-containing protein n=1 Tax=Nonomuraea sp. NPDC050227 TaxID=3364360 RepID=UPI0037901AB2